MAEAGSSETEAIHFPHSCPRCDNGCLLKFRGHSRPRSTHLLTSIAVAFSFRSRKSVHLDRGLFCPRIFEQAAVSALTTRIRATKHHSAVQRNLYRPSESEQALEFAGPIDTDRSLTVARSRECKTPSESRADATGEGGDGDSLDSPVLPGCQGGGGRKVSGGGTLFRWTWDRPAPLTLFALMPNSRFSTKKCQKNFSARFGEWISENRSRFPLLRPPTRFNFVFWVLRTPYTIAP